MDKQDKWFVTGTVAVILGNLLGFILILGMVWADFEGSLFLPSLIGDKYVVRNLDCPVLMTRNETREISFTLRNPGEKERSRLLEGMISEGHVKRTREIKREVTIEPGGKEKATWDIYPEDAVYERIVLFHVYVWRASPYPSLEATCGVLVLDIPILTGAQLMGIVLGLILTLILGGNTVLLLQYWKDLVGARRRYLSRAMFAMSIFTILGIWLSTLGYWEFGSILLFASSTILVYLAASSLVNRVFGSQNT
ncbi:MAG: hypothetical protein R6U57_06500 [Anaerolineales bacterium]